MADTSLIGVLGALAHGELEASDTAAEQGAT